MITAGVNLLWCRPGRVGGSEEYLARQLAGLGQAAPDVALRLLVPPGYAAAHPDLVRRADVGTGWRGTGTRPGRLAAEIAWLPRRLAGVDVVHHAGGTVPARSPRPIVLTVHDLQYLRYPRYFSAPRRRYLSWALPRSIARAAVVAVPSEFVATTVGEAFGAPGPPVVVVPHGIDPPLVAPAREAELRARYGLGDRRVLVYPAITHPHKGHRFLLDVLARAWTHPDLVLVLLGGEGAAEAEVRRAVAAAGLGARVVRPGRVPAADRDGLVALAEALVFPSEYEGFGAPVLEAMALGTPVVCSDRAALPEVAGGAAVVRPLELDAWAGALDAVAADRDGLVVRGRARAARFSAAASGAALAGAYRRAIGGARP